MKKPMTKQTQNQMPIAYITFSPQDLPSDDMINSKFFCHILIVTVTYKLQLYLKEVYLKAKIKQWEESHVVRSRHIMHVI